MSPRQGFTAFELMAVVAIIAVVASMSAVPLLPALRKGVVNDAANQVMRVCDQARLLAMSRQGGSAYYGVTLAQDAGGKSYVALTFGATATPSDILMHAGKPAARADLSPTVALFAGGDQGSSVPLSGSIGWLYQYRTGFPVATASQLSSAVISVGSGEAGPLPRSLSVRSRDGRHAMAISVYQIGLGHAGEM